MSSSSSMCEQQPNDDVCVFMCVSLCNRKNFTICFDYAGDSKPEADGEYLKVFHCVCKVLETQDIKKKREEENNNNNTPILCFPSSISFFTFLFSPFLGQYSFLFLGRWLIPPPSPSSQCWRRKLRRRIKKKTKIGRKMNAGQLWSDTHIFKKKMKKRKFNIRSIIIICTVYLRAFYTPIFPLIFLFFFFFVLTHFFGRSYYYTLHFFF